MPEKLVVNKGDRFARLSVLEEQPTKYRTRMFLCLCDCGNEKVVSLSHLRSGHTTSCGCYNREQASVRRMKFNLPKGYSAVKDRSMPEFKIWLNMVTRCYNPGAIGWEYYGGKGIRISKEWLQESGMGFYQFFEDMGVRPPKYNIDRIDPTKDYCKENCRWVSPSMSSFNCGMSSRNTSGVSGVAWNKRLSKWVARIGKDYRRINLGCFTSFEEAVSARKAAELLYFGEYCPC